MAEMKDNATMAVDPKTLLGGFDPADATPEPTGGKTVLYLPERGVAFELSALRSIQTREIAETTTTSTGVKYCYQIVLNAGLVAGAGNSLGEYVLDFVTERARDGAFDRLMEAWRARATVITV